MEHGYVTVNQVPTRVVTFGGWIDKPIRNNKIVLVIPGNPGLIGYYEIFMQALYNIFDESISVWGIGQAGHEVPYGTSSLPCLQKHPELFTLKGQVQHKIEFVKTYIPNNTKIYFIGHSIGAKICVELVKEFFTSHHAYAYLLFPTLERMAETPSGKKLWPILGPLRKVVVYGAALLNWLPRSFLTRVVQWTLNFTRRPSMLAIEGGTQLTGSLLPEVNVHTTMNLLHPQALERSLFMAHDELQVVRDLDVETIQQLSQRLRFYYGTNDHWCPVDYYENLKKHIPSAETILCQHGIEHAFVLRSSHFMATKVAHSIRSDWQYRQP